MASEFWSWFESVVPLMPLRAVSWRRAFQYLDKRPGPVVLVETGCARDPGNWLGDGQSTVLLDRYAQSRGPGSRVWSVDINPDQVAVCRGMVSSQVIVDASDSVAWLHDLNSRLPAPVDFLYLDSFDVDWMDIMPSSRHHLKELTAIRPSLKSYTLVMVDDSPLITHAWMKEDGGMEIIGENRIGGKGYLVAEYAKQVGARLEWHHYQTAWTGLA